MSNKQCLSLEVKNKFPNRFKCEAIIKNSDGAMGGKVFFDFGGALFRNKGQFKMK